MKNKILFASYIVTFSLCLAGCSKSQTVQVNDTEKNTSKENVDCTGIADTIISETLVPETIVPESEELPPPSISLVMVGDILLHTPVEESALQEDGSYNFDAIFANVKEEIKAADLALVNQEVILGGEEFGISGYPAFNAPQEDQNSVYVYEQDGIRIAILNYTYGTNGIPLPADMPYAVDLLEKEKVVADLQKAEELADFTIVCPHWGTEYKLESSSEQKKWAQIFLENGVDLVLGTHPHVIEPIEWLTDEETGNEMLVYYSLGNFVNWTSSSGEGIANRMVGGMADITIGLKENGTVAITDYSVTALVCHLQDGTNGVTTYTLSDYTEEQGNENAIIAQDANFSKEYCVNLCNEVWGAFWN